MFRNKFRFEVSGKREIETSKFKPVSCFHNIHIKDQDYSNTYFSKTAKYRNLKQHKNIIPNLELIFHGSNKDSVYKS